MKVEIERQQDGRLTIEIDTKTHPEAQVLYDLIGDIRPWPESLLEGVEQARHPEQLTADNVPFFTGNETEAQVTPDGVLVENMWTGGRMFLSHGDFVDFVDTYLRLLELRKRDRDARHDASGMTET
ncbi:hypothetical protein [Goodfellowiella coeruleoviolacea]|uniref:Uncharacterized protein n=1 Tax=Goodfellowiella coeruleoviolacea TaxID=334858 RepID=A0AAE3GIN5_9PSEU|nr:hypothetical protein [Goodfellowiella coeruleoviolacea]MCP2168059.1 hypothetical protein [Goodfellowiella coeruleoviolacea]